MSVTVAKSLDFLYLTLLGPLSLLTVLQELVRWVAMLFYFQASESEKPVTSLVSNVYCL